MLSAYAICICACDFEGIKGRVGQVQVHVATCLSAVKYPCACVDVAAVVDLVPRCVSLFEEK